MTAEAEREMGLRWLAKRGRPVAAPTPYLEALLATRNAFAGGLRWLLPLALVTAAVAGVGYHALFGRGMTFSYTVYFFCFGIQLAVWLGIRSRQRQLAKATRPWPGAVREPWTRSLGAWFVASTVLAYGGGAALALAIWFTTPARTYALSWLGLLGLSALCAATVLAGFLRAPVLAEDPASLAVYRAVLAENIHGAAPALAAVPPVLDLVITSHLPAGYRPWLAGYAALVVVTELVAYVRHRRPLPPGDYGVPRPAQTDVD
ncbi:hypothetical protein [Amycolatopsis sp. cmx-4-68]|uniref:hypothetical protein n=1 Tax=Amycolatopsis sp. cmx-4-68 TaxID=2790938 RepID=UPI00397A12CE